MTIVFFKSLLERALKTFCQTLVAAMGVGVTGFLSVDWVQALSLAGVATLLSVLTSVGSAPWGDDATPSLVKVTGPTEGSMHE